MIDDDLFQKIMPSDSFRKSTIDSFSRFILIFNLESPTLQHFEEGLQTLKILLGGRLDAFCNSVVLEDENPETKALVLTVSCIKCFDGNCLGFTLFDRDNPVSLV